MPWTLPLAERDAHSASRVIRFISIAVVLVPFLLDLLVGGFLATLMNAYVVSGDLAALRATLDLMGLANVCAFWAWRSDAADRQEFKIRL